MARQSEKTLPPAEIELVYRNVDGSSHSHVFTASNVAGFYYGSTSLRRTFAEVEKALGLHVSRLFKTTATYKLAMTFEDFEKRLEAKRPSGD